MFGEESAVGFIPAPIIGLRAGNLYNVAISLLVFLGCAYAAWAILARGKKGVLEKSYSFFLLSMGAHGLAAAAGNLLAWLNLLSRFSAIAYLVKVLSVFPPLSLVYFLGNEIFESRSNVRRTTFVFFLVALAYLTYTFRLDAAQSVLSYWGVQWLISPLPLLIYIFGLLFPLEVVALYLLIKNALAAWVQKSRVNLTLYFGAIIFVLLEYLQVSASVVTWQRLLARLFYILIAFGAYLYFIGRAEEKKFVAREEEAEVRPMLRVPFFAKLLFMFLLLAVIPITVSSLLMFVSFKEIIDLYIYQPLLWNLKTSREAFLMALTHVQIQALFLMILTGLLVFLSSVIVSRSIAEALRSIAQGMGRVSRGDFSFKLRRDSNDEIGDVIEYFNNMSAEIKRSREIMEKWNRELELKVSERTEDLRVLYDVSKAIGSTLDLELLIGRAVERLLPIMKAEAYAILTPDERGDFRARFCRGCDLKDAVVKEGAWPAGWLATPLRAKGQTKGVLLIEAKQPVKERAANLLSAISDQLAVALENVGIYEREKEAVARLTELDRLKNEFISMVSHELRTPVTSADGYISLFLTGMAGPLTEEQKKYLAVVKDNDQRLLTLINRLLDFSQIETGRFSLERKLISMHEVINSALTDLKPMLEKRSAKVKLDLSAKHASFMGDRAKMKELFVNLIDNALKFSREEEPPRIEISTRDAGDFIQVEVMDQGMGMEKEHLEKVFNKFYQVEETMTRKVGGVGLGLAIAKEIIGNHQGKIWAESEGKGKGARFIFTVPVAEKA